jgi:hypothetical protein
MQMSSTWKGKIAGFDVTFPQRPYGVQQAFMDKVLRAIDTESHALLEAPTGCGKTCAQQLLQLLHTGALGASRPHWRPHRAAASQAVPAVRGAGMAAEAQE